MNKYLNKIIDTVEIMDNEDGAHLKKGKANKKGAK